MNKEFRPPYDRLYQDLVDAGYNDESAVAKIEIYEEGDKHHEDMIDTWHTLVFARIRELVGMMENWNANKKN